VILLDMTIEEGMRYIISLGVVAPNAARHQPPSSAPPLPTRSSAQPPL